MAKRKRLSSPQAPRASSDSVTNGLETKSDFSNHPLTGAPRPRPHAPIAQVIGDAAAQSALEELAEEMQAARAEGRMVQALPLEAITERHMVRDRMGHDLEEMGSLKASIAARGQQTPIEVVELEDGQYGLISGWRRLHALRSLLAETGEARFTTIAALVKSPGSVSESYVAMVEENEIRSDLSFYERANIVAEAVRLNIFPTPSIAIKTLFANATPSRRSKISNFVDLHNALGDVLQFPTQISEKLGLALVKGIKTDVSLTARFRTALRKVAPDSAAAERAVLEGVLRSVGHSKTASATVVDVAEGVRLEMRRGRVLVSGPGVTENLQRKLEAWLRSQ